MADLPKEYRTLVRRRILSLRRSLLNGVSLSTLSLRSSIPRERLTVILGGQRRHVHLETAVAIADAAGVKVRTLASYLRRVRAIRNRALFPKAIASR
jgi:LPS O-antigen subunit length determinant protein (WzzB/FepE family)